MNFIKPKNIFEKYLKLNEINREILYGQLQISFEPIQLASFLGDSMYISAILNRWIKQNKDCGFTLGKKTFRSLEDLLEQSGAKEKEELRGLLINYINSLMPIEFGGSKNFTKFIDIFKRYNIDHNFEGLRNRLRQLKIVDEVIVIGSGHPNDISLFCSKIGEYYTHADSAIVQGWPAHEEEHYVFSLKAAKAIDQKKLFPKIGIDVLYINNKLDFVPYCGTPYLGAIINGYLDQKNFDIFRKIAGQNPTHLSRSDKVLLPVKRGDSYQK